LTIPEFEHIRKEEGDYFEFYSYNLKCYGSRGPLFAWNGYIEIPKIHGFYGKYNESGSGSGIMVHGGITYDECTEDILTIGFDCAHSGDFTPGFLYTLGERFKRDGDTYKDVEYIRTELESVSKQIHEISPEYYDVLVETLKKMNKN